MIKVTNLRKEFLNGQESTLVLKGVNVHIEEGEFVAIMGPSGSGKSTLLQLLGGLDVPSEGEIEIDQVSLHDMKERQRTIFRRKKLGFVFQNYQLLPALTVEENIAFPLHADGKLSTENSEWIHELIRSVGLEGFDGKRANLLSGGQQQRVAIARALANHPTVLLADEPTGNLDRARAEEILVLLSSLHRKNKQTIVMVTHDIFAAGFADRIILFKDGVIDQVISRKDSDYAKYLANFMA
ncbi:ABC transporter ATP-binding protein [Sporosarcina sp. Te-1]|uniref:ABC transporter ATP-binding protein n=1 Tax=Sporosarcina sp. Te-1 TaxID=2818390 RepID=UPI001A9E5CAA|nr:ABC transporter ATP-binding protein [Sporosarcina sp. Te-1]QTD41873.1 ABC transporter ATP-binding protein [Sporosarcina sp. Te-1]